MFAEGWLQGASAWGRPVDVLVMPDGALLVSDDRLGAIYRISYKGIEESVLPDGKRNALWGRIRMSKLLPNYPNPFNPETWIPYMLADPANVAIRIYSATGQLVRSFDVERRGAGAYLEKARAAYWDGRNNAGERAASGIYFYRMQADHFTSIRRMELIP